MAIRPGHPFPVNQDPVEWTRAVMRAITNPASHSRPNAARQKGKFLNQQLERCSAREGRQTGQPGTIRFPGKSASAQTGKSPALRGHSPRETTLHERAQARVAANAVKTLRQGTAHVYQVRERLTGRSRSCDRSPRDTATLLPGAWPRPIATTSEPAGLSQCPKRPS